MTLDELIKEIEEEINGGAEEIVKYSKAGFFFDAARNQTRNNALIWVVEKLKSIAPEKEAEEGWKQVQIGDYCEVKEDDGAGVSKWMLLVRWQCAEGWGHFSFGDTTCYGAKLKDIKTIIRDGKTIWPTQN